MANSDPAVSLIERIPPHNKDAEVAVLGGMILDSDALTRVIQLIEPDYFYIPAHTVIFGHIRDLFSKGQPVDFISITDSLRAKEELDRVGGSSYIMNLVHSIPTTANIEYYAQIVERYAILRKLIRAGTKIVEMGYQQDEMDMSHILNQAEQLVFEIGQHKLSGGLEHIQSGLWHLFEELERGYNDPESLMRKNMSTGFTDLNTMLGGGFGPSDLIILAARPAMGKTALALNIGLNMATQLNKPVAIFNLEMSKEQLITRMLCMESGMNSRALRSGTLHTDEWQSLSNAIAKLSEAPVYIDDSSMATPGEIRAKCRRLKAEKKDLGLIMIDYLQLMETGSGENRQQEISKISRSLKQLARELDVPVVALSQLSRAVESRTNKRPMLSDLRECVTGDTCVLLSDGRRVPIQDLVGTTPHVLAVSEAGHVIQAQSDKVWSVGHKEVFEVRLSSGRSIKTTAEHRLLSFSGWKKLKDLEPGARLALARSLPESTEPVQWPDAQVALLGQLIGDGSYLSGQPMRFTSASEANFQAVTAGAESLGSTVKRYRGRGQWEQLLISGNGNRWHPAGVNRWLRQLGIYNQRSHEKRIPQAAFQLSQAQVALLLKHLWATDGSIYIRRSGKGSHRIFFASVSCGLVEDIAVLLLRLGIVGRLRTTVQKTGTPLYTIDVSGAAFQLRFLKTVGAFGPRRDVAAELETLLEQQLETQGQHVNVDTLPQAIFEEVKATMAAQGVTHRQMAALRGTTYGGSAHFNFSPSRAVVLDYAEKLKSVSLTAQASNDLFWDQILEIVPLGTQEVFDLTVPGPACWLADGLVSHNSGAIEQDADVVMFLYRDEYYNPDSNDKNTAELIVAKHRHGPTGPIRLYFEASLTKFGNLLAV